MNKLLIAAFALGAWGFAQSAVSAPTASHAPGIASEGLAQQAADRDGNWSERSDRRRGFWGRENGYWRDEYLLNRRNRDNPNRRNEDNIDNRRRDRE